VGRLSGGEQARVHIARLMREPADLLILDEPTNDLDIPTLEVLEESLAEFEGGLVLVTHDRFMLERVSTVIVALDGRGEVATFADYAQWEAARDVAEPPRRPATEPAPSARAHGRRASAISSSASGTAWSRRSWTPSARSRRARARWTTRRSPPIRWRCSSGTRRSSPRAPRWTDSTPAGRAGGEAGLSARSYPRRISVATYLLRAPASGALTITTRRKAASSRIASHEGSSSERRRLNFGDRGKA